jgi:GGDEF domain-containing protein
MRVVQTEPMTEVEEAPSLKPPKDGGPAAVQSGGGRPPCVLVVLHTRSREGLGAKIEVQGSRFTIGAGSDDFRVDDAAKSGTRAEVVWAASDEMSATIGWRLRGVGRVFVNDEVVVDRALRSGDELRVVDAFFRFLSGDDVQNQYHQTIYHLTITDFASGAYNGRYLREVLERETVRATRYGKAFSVAVVAVGRGGVNAEGAPDWLRALVSRLKTDGRRDWLVARASELELVIVSSESTPTFRVELAMAVRAGVPAGVQVSLGFAEHEPEKPPERMLQDARTQAVLLSG